jgi:hypothetical protein
MLSQALSGVTIVILTTASYALFMFWISINNYQQAVNVTSSVENHLLAVQNELNRQAQSWNFLDFGHLSRSEQGLAWSRFQLDLNNNQGRAIRAYADMHSTSPARPDLGKFLALYGDIARHYELQKVTLEVGDSIGPVSRQKLRTMIQRANRYLDQSVHILHGRVSSMTLNNQAFIDNGSAASVITFSLSLTTLIFLSAGLYYRRRLL